jgi:glycerol-3-phosphate dehydrogenase (NAD(P)+)
MVPNANKHPKKISVIGLGAWGSSLALYCARQGHDVLGWHRDESHLAAIRLSKNLSITKTYAASLPDNLKVTSDLSLCRGRDLTIVALPASAWSGVIPALMPLSSGIVISATKGLEKSSNTTPLTWANEALKLSPERLCVISGPSFAKDLAERTPVTLVSASSDLNTAKEVATILASETLRLYPSNDPLGVELGGILKNVIALAVGMSDALGYGPSTRAALITRGLAEMTRLAVALGAQRQTLAGLSGLGDLVMTSTDDQSRNRVVGLRLGRGEALNEILSSLGATAEGVSSAELVETIAKSRSVDAPIVSLVVKVLKGQIAPKDLAHTLMTRPIREEF